jgi:DNA-binding transcriptional MerR regulator
MAYTAKEVAQKLQKEGYSDVTARTVNYYAFEKKMFEVSLTGKNCFTEKEIEKIKAIKKLQQTTNFTLEQIKEIINRYDYEDIVERTSPIVYQKVEDFYQSLGYMKSLITSSIQSSSMSNCFQNFQSSCFSANCQSSQTVTSAAVDVLRIDGGQRTIRINQDITLTVSNQIDIDTLAQIVKSIQKITQQS